MNRTPPKAVRQELAREVGFGCPVANCGNPYLTWHHFAPSWSERQHHDPAGMLALCAAHHDKADAGAFTVDQLKALKANPYRHSADVGARFDWLRYKVLAVVGGNFYYETPQVVVYREQPLIWFNRSAGGELLLNLRLPTTTDEPRLQLDDNDWMLRGEPEDFNCPPSGRLIHAKYSNGDEVRIEYFDVESAAAMRNRYIDADPSGWFPSQPFEFPLTIVEIQMNVANSMVSFGPRVTSVGGISMRNCFSSHNRIGLRIR